MDTLITDINIATMRDGNGYDPLYDAALAIKDGLISWVGHRQDSNRIDASTTIEAGGKWLTPGLIDCHTHLVYGGHRADEFELKLAGASYEQIARSGGGIVSTVQATRALGFKELLDMSAPRLRRLLSEGVTTLEIKSGYGLNLEDELKMLRVARQLGQEHDVTIKTTFLGAHALPGEYDNQISYIDFLINDVLPEVVAEGLADAVDFFCESIGFDLPQCQRIAEAANQSGLALKGHVEQLSYLRGALLVADFGGLSVDHLEYLPESDVAYLKQADTVAVLLPGAFYCLGETQLPPIQKMLDTELPIAIATDLNPGSSPIASLLNVMNLACTQFKLTPESVLKGVTCHAAKALGMQDEVGQIRVGLKADLALWAIDTPAQLCYGMNLVKPEMVFKDGIVVNPTV